ncbi:MAG: flagellar basal body-associated FliL family protein [Paracoccaceae bacterium]
MTAEAQPQEPPRKSSKLPLFIGLFLALAGGGGAFWVTYSGMAAGWMGGESGHESASAANDDHASHEGGPTHVPRAAAGFVPLDPITINLGPRANARVLRFVAQLEVEPGSEAEIGHLMPRIMDVLNIYLRALDPVELEEPASLMRLRGQMLRRVQIVTGQGRVRDLLIMEFVLN